MVSADEIRKYAKEYRCSHAEAKKSLMRESLCKELRNDQTLSDAVDTLIRILDMEFGGYDY